MNLGIWGPSDQFSVKLIGSPFVCHGPKSDNLGIRLHRDQLVIKLIGSLSFMVVLSAIT